MTKVYMVAVLLGLFACFVTVSVMVLERGMGFWTSVGAIMIPTGLAIVILATSVIRRRRR